ncbi:MAG: cytochrome c biogenesis heme-transporting ATPase CcmA [Betaproteobacteria bacterium]|nr:cytochrome c biogenesis heme-transporting ATPase CcmA [Betaproteobacteria bacterium]
MLEASRITCVRGDRQLFAGLDFALAPGELLEVRGPNGCGKTSLLRIVCGLLAPEAGEIRWQGGAARSRRDEFHSALFYFGHAMALKEELTALENLQVSCGLAGEAVDEAGALAALARVGLGRAAHLPARSLSQGQRRRAVLARLWFSTRPLWVLDEPFNALDTTASAALAGLFQEHLHRGGMLMMTTHLPLPFTPPRLHALNLGPTPC